MIIVSKYKDYYDYLQGIYGRDEKIVLDRTKGFVPDIPYDFETLRWKEFLICGTHYKVIQHAGRFYTEEQLSKLGFIVVFKKYSSYDLEIIPTPANYKPPHKWMFDVEQEEKRNAGLAQIAQQCPIQMLVLGHWEHWPKLADFNFASIISAEDMWVNLYNWLSRIEDIPDKRTNNEKILTAGFDIKESFRPKIK